MTLPHVLAYALKRRTGKPEARYVFGLGEWCIEDTRDRDSLIVTLKTTDGFEASFGIPFQTCRTLGFSLQHEANEAIAAGERDERGCRDRHPTKSSPTRRYRGQSIAIMTSEALTTA